MKPHNSQSVDAQGENGDDAADVTDDNFLKTLSPSARTALLALSRSSKPESGAPSPTRTDFARNGPQPQFRFVWGETSVKCSNYRYRLLVALWDSERWQPYAERSQDEVMYYIWNDYKDHDHPLHDLCHQVRRLFRDAGIPLTIESQGGMLWLAEMP